jgi:putative PIN family toxin of toxin-antitoxin system
MVVPHIVIDTSVFIAALRSQYCAAYQLLMMTGTGRFEVNLSVPLVLEYEEVAARQSDVLRLSAEDIEGIIDYLCFVGQRRKIHYLWRPVLCDPKDDMILEVAVAGRCEYLVNYSTHDFRGSDKFGIKIVTPQAFLQKIGELL